MLDNAAADVARVRAPHPSPLVSLFEAAAEPLGRLLLAVSVGRQFLTPLR